MMLSEMNKFALFEWKNEAANSDDVDEMKVE